MSNIEQQIENARTLQESYNSLANSLEQLAALIEKNEQSVVARLYTTSGSPTWTDYQLTVHDIADGTQSVVSLDAQGKGEFTVPIGHIYEVIFPTLPGFITPQKEMFSATYFTNTITYTYATETNIEKLRILVVNGLTGASSTCLNGETLTVSCTDQTTYSGEVEGSTCMIEISYGKTYTFTPPTVAGYRTESEATTITAGIAIRNLTIRYTETQYGMFGVDVDGNMYTISEMEALADKTIIKYGFYNDADLNNSTRVNNVGGSTGNGFYWEVGKESLGTMAWAAGNDNFDTVRLPYYSNLSSWKYAGRYMTDTIIAIGLELYPSSANPTPAATACANKTITIGNRTHRGILLAYDQIHKIATDNRTQFLSFYSALGRTVPSIWSGYWWTSCLNSSAYAVLLSNGGFYSGYKTDSGRLVMVGFDL